MIIVALFMGATISCAQDYVRQGKEFIQKKKEKSFTKDDIKTGYTWTDSKGRVYDIYLSPRGSCYILVKSQKTGKLYKSYLPKEIAEEIKKEIK